MLWMIHGWYKLSKIDRWRHSQNPIILCRISLSHHKTLSTTSRTPRPIGILWTHSIERGSNGLSNRRSIIQCNCSKILQKRPIDIAWTFQCPWRRIPGKNSMASICSDSRITLRHRIRQPQRAHRSRESTSSGPHESTIPPSTRHPYLDGNSIILARMCVFYENFTKVQSGQVHFKMFVELR